MKNVVNGSIIILSASCASLVYRQNEMVNQNDKTMLVASILIMGLLALFSYNKVSISPTVATNKISDLLVYSISTIFQPNTRSEKMVVRARNKRK